MYKLAKMFNTTKWKQIIALVYQDFKLRRKLIDDIWNAFPCQLLILGIEYLEINIAPFCVCVL